MASGPWLLVVFVLSIILVLVTIIRFKLNPFVALLITTVFTGILVGMPLNEIAENLAVGFGNTLKGIGLVIGLGIIFGGILSESGAASRIAHSLVDAFGENKATLALAITGYLVCIPVFYDAAFVILIALAMNLSKITKKPIIVLATPLAIGLITSHNMIAPTPGPVEVGNNLQLDMGTYVIYALIVAIPGMLFGWLYSNYVGKNESYDGTVEVKQEEKSRVSDPSSFLSYFVLLLPMLLILVGNTLALFLPIDSDGYAFFKFIGNKNIALLFSLIVAIYTLRKYISRPLTELVMATADKSGMILLITGAGGAFGFLISSSGIGDYIVNLFAAANISILFAGFLLAAILRAAQGSSTVSLVTTSAILGPAALQSGVPPILIALAICAGGNCASLPNDSAFWVTSRFVGINVNQTLKAWTLGATLAGIVMFVFVLILSWMSGILPGLA
jgi:GntP family gluconate:H+ symporter